jgi:hypothetical protein
MINAIESNRRLISFFYYFIFQALHSIIHPLISQYLSLYYLNAKKVPVYVF